MFSLKPIYKAVAAALFAGMTMVSPAQAITVSGVSAIFDNGDDLLQISGTVTSTSRGDFSEIGFDWDRNLNNFDFTGVQLLSSNVGGTAVPGGGGLTRGAFTITGMTGGTFSAGFAFNFLVYIPNANGRFLSRNIDIFICDDCTPGFSGGEVINGVTTPVAGDLSVPSAVPLPASLPLLLAAMGGIALWRRRRAAA